ncbi:FACT complex subunit [Wickerhamomyces ciferrii]|uniref:FACT complex subunit POB3 n=1 Tax=Wickerhamomyces ciferrii (strain ATCC 14091 / BCRC 22168 / CBS 111 / JCM 3599 / NBRC 0793 / NRRL Y-1031 F-60-10) TaxID=1206466 RepID=K0K6V3_WICCF|nr:FACT complex subunit [Wickerhamomyces ciferrii]CCH40630.1 FACT complex subunit [Wickerhamomyces ciferrii]
MSGNLDFEKIYLNQSKAFGRFRIAETGLGWKAAAAGGSANKTQPFLLPSEELSSAQWSRGSRGYEIKIQTKNKGVVKLDGFDQQDFNQLKNGLQQFNIQLDHREHSLRGWNWGNTDLARNELIFNVSGKPAFEIPYAQISNSNLASKNEVAIDMDPLQGNDFAGDELVEVRFYVPGNVPYEDDDVPEDDKEEKTAASAFYENLKDKADIGQVAGEALASFNDILFLTPRGRFDVEMYRGSLRLRGKTYDHKIQYRQVERIFSLPKPDDIHHLMVIQVNPPLRQGNTPYPFLVLQFSKDEELELEINIDDDEFQEKYSKRLNKNYDQQTHLVLSHVFRGLTERRVIIPGSFLSKHGQPAVSCSLKVNEGYLYLLENNFLFVTKPTVYIPYNDVSSVSISRAGDSSTSNRTFDLEVNLRGSPVSHTFANITKEEQNSLESFLKSKGVKVKNDEIEQQARINAVLANDLDSSDSDVNMGSASEDESPDEDFNDGGSGSDSDLAEEFDSDAPLSDDDEPPAKKAKNE